MSNNKELKGEINSLPFFSTSVAGAQFHLGIEVKKNLEERERLHDGTKGNFKGRKKQTIENLVGDILVVGDYFLQGVIGRVVSIIKGREKWNSGFEHIDGVHGKLHCQG